MGKYSTILIAAVMILGFSAAAIAHTTENKDNNYGWPDKNADGSPRAYDNPDCEKDQSALTDGVSPAIADNGAHACEGEQWHGNSTFTGESCNLHGTDKISADADSWCIRASPSNSQGGWQEGKNGPVDATTAGSVGTGGVKAMVGVGIFWTGETAAGADVSGDKATAGWYGEDETDQNPVLAPVCKAFFNLDPARTGPGVDNCLAYWFEIAGIVHGQIGDDPQPDECSFEEYNSHSYQRGDFSRDCHRDHTSISATALLP